MSNSDLISLVMIDKKRKVRVTVELQDKDEDTIAIPEVLHQLTEYFKDQMDYDLDGDAIGAVPSQIMPLMSQAIGQILPSLVGDMAAHLLLVSESARMSLISSMTVAFLLLKFIQQKELRIVTTEESVSESEIDELEEANRISEVASLGAMFGLSPKEILRKMMENGDISSEELRSQLNQYLSDDEEVEEVEEEEDDA